MALNIVDESTLTVAGTSIGLSSANPTLVASELLGARQAVITIKTAPVYYRQDGDDATSSDTILYPGDMLNLLGDSMHRMLEKVRFLRVGSTSAILIIRWYDRDVVNVPTVTRATKGSHIITPTTGNNTALATLDPAGDFHLLGIRVFVGSALASAETLTVTLDANAGAAYDIVLRTLDMGTPDIRSVMFHFGEGEDYFVSGDKIVVALSANTGSDTWGCETIHELT